MSVSSCFFILNFLLKWTWILLDIGSQCSAVLIANQILVWRYTRICGFVNVMRWKVYKWKLKNFHICNGKRLLCLQKEKTSMQCKIVNPRFGPDMLFWVDKNNCELGIDVQGEWKATICLWQTVLKVLNIENSAASSCPMRVLYWLPLLHTF